MKEELKFIGTVFGARIYTEAKDEERINLIMDFLEKKQRQADQIEIDQMLGRFTKNH